MIRVITFASLLCIILCLRKKNIDLNQVLLHDRRQAFNAYFKVQDIDWSKCSDSNSWPCVSCACLVVTGVASCLHLHSTFFNLTADSLINAHSGTLQMYDCHRALSDHVHPPPTTHHPLCPPCTVHCAPTLYTDLRGRAPTAPSPHLFRAHLLI
jgi:hypothetical protein